MTDPLDAFTFTRRLAELTRALASQAAGGSNQDCIECVRSSACVRCTFCQDCEALLRSHYCVRCARCSDSSHCRDSAALIGCRHCVLSERCTSSSYVERSVGLIGCTYCFGCVGLSQRDFHILNEPYERTLYFAQVQRLAAQLSRGDHQDSKA